MPYCIGLGMAIGLGAGLLLEKFGTTKNATRTDDELDTLGTVLDKYNESQRQLKSLQAELDVAKNAIKENPVGVTREAIQRELDEARCQIKALKAERDATVEERDSTAKELVASKQQRKKSFTAITSDLSEISKKLDTVGTSWTPWKEIVEIKGQVERMQSASNEDLLHGA